MDNNKIFTEEVKNMKQNSKAPPLKEVKNRLRSTKDEQEELERRLRLHQ